MTPQDTLRLNKIRQGNFTEPKDTLWLLDKLKDRGFTDEHFESLHHMEAATIASHRGYCTKKVGKFQPDQNNARVQRRLEYVLREKGKNPARLFPELVNEANKEFPPVKT